MNSPRALMHACWIVPIIFGLYSLGQGADSNWDLRNYHLYNAYAFLHGRLAVDLAPAGMQSYFNPLLDVPYYLMTMHLPAMLVGFIMGVIHGLNFVLVLGICRLTLSDLPESLRYRAPFWLALAGCVTANFLSAVGNSMGDNTTSLVSLGALLIVLRIWPRLAQTSVHVIAMLFLGGIVSGAGAGLKLTTVVYSVALCGGLLFAPVSIPARFRAAFVFGLGVLAGLAMTGGFWFAELWTRYGNPLYPQFSSVFPSPLTAPVSVVDTQWLPKNLWEALAYPFIFSINPHRVAQARLHQIIWAVAYVCFWSWVIYCGARALKRSARPLLPSRGRYVIAYVVIGFVVWMKLFSIQRYLVAVEVCLPLVIYLLLGQMLAYERAQRICKRILIACSVLVLIGGAHSWGHESWARNMFSIDLPPLAEPEKTTVLLTAGDPPLGWMVPLFPQDVAFATTRSAFPQARPAFDNKIHEIARSRGGPVYALIPGYWDKDRYDVPRNAREMADSQAALADYGFSLDVASCVLYKGHIGAGTYPYQWCRLASKR
ncbi:hypothetical protein R8871_06288 [Paraburkholderia graminis C4D1M]|uniref:DUF2029 domain-containing protein n=2 Tax=Paraburkholderia graminis TaxID=60548 RepID=B1G8E2_PARG4|nr:hypothetical protein [Paraburkholderia graminis]EDT07641.1 conserved hypothetical protein [Paraburkholderia graminis C4D1M]CAB3736962.1 hypothetical protein R8871_06288 [Paraburkholderia graminis C4D1M]